MTRRRNGWDYCAPGRYMITLSLADRTRPWLGELAGKPGELASELASTMALSILGQLIAELWQEIAVNWPGVVVEEFVVMPDHLHGILYITCRQRHPLGQIVGSFKARSTAAARRLAEEQEGIVQAAIVTASLLAGSSLWSPGLTDSILYSEERRQRAIAYIADNPRRLAAKRANPALFTVCRDLAIPLPLGADGGEITAHFNAIGNHELLHRLDFHQVQCSRRYFAYRRDKYGNPIKDEPPEIEMAEFRLASELASTMAKAGVVLVNPCISHGEREIARRAFAGGSAMIILRNKGFSSLYKPEGSLFDRCAEGRLLMLAPAAWPYTPGKKQMTRDDACVLNRIAQAIARDGAADIDYKGRTPVDVDGMARRAVVPDSVK
jgi:REP element-mobilizing transposase RayT